MHRCVRGVFQPVNGGADVLTWCGSKARGRVT